MASHLSLYQQHCRSCTRAKRIKTRNRFHLARALTHACGSNFAERASGMSTHYHDRWQRFATTPPRAVSKGGRSGSACRLRAPPCATTLGAHSASAARWLLECDTLPSNGRQLTLERAIVYPRTCDSLSSNMRQFTLERVAAHPRTCGSLPSNSTSNVR